MDYVESARLQLVPLMTELIDDFDDNGQIMERSFFTMRLVQANSMQVGSDLLHLFLELSTTAFQGFSFTPGQAAKIDHLLAVAENISFALSASSSDAH